MSNSKSEGMKMVPVRGMADFLLDTKKYQPPTFNDLKRFNNRVTSNLLYYQTNYFVVAGVVFSLFLTFGFSKMLCGSFGVSTSVAGLLFVLDRLPLPQVTSLRTKYPAAVFGVGALNLLIVYLSFRPILFFALSLLLPLAVSIIHASMRSRGIKNKINNKMEQLGAPVYTNSPMGFVLSSLGLETKDFEE